MKKVMIICAAVLALTSINALAAGSKRPPKWPPVVSVNVDAEIENHIQ